MPTKDDTPKNENLYFMDPESGAEMARLLEQDRLFTRSMGGLFSELLDLAKINHILDVACGPGGWALEVAYTHPRKKVVGIDISQTMIQYASAQAEVQGLDNASFKIMDIQQPLEFPDNSFDLVNARLTGWFPPDLWPRLVGEYARITRPGGVIRLTEPEVVISTTPASEKVWSLFCQAFKRAGQSFSPDGRLLCVVPKLARFLRDAGCVDVQTKPHLIDYSAGTEANAAFYKNMLFGLKLLQPFFISMEVTTQKEIDQLYEQMLAEILSDDFCALHLLVTAWGKKPVPV